VPLTKLGRRHARLSEVAVTTARLPANRAAVAAAFDRFGASGELPEGRFLAIAVAARVRHGFAVPLCADHEIDYAQVARE
jgi:hypothetical protein